MTADDVREAINRSGLTQVEITKLTKISQPALSDFLTGKTGDALGKWLKLLTILGLTTSPKRSRGRGAATEGRT